MNNILKQYNKEVKQFALIYFILGIILCFFNKSILTMGTRIIGGILIIFGGIELYIYFVKRTSSSAIPLFIGLPVTAFGCIMLFSPESIIAIIPILAGILLIINSIIQLQKSLILKDYGYENWIYNFGISIVLILAGTLLFLKPIQSVAFLLQIIGICLIIESISMLISHHEIKKYLN